MLAGLIVWGARFLFVYAFTAISCARGRSGGAAFGLVELVHAGLRLRRTAAGPAGDDQRFVHLIAALVAGIGLLAILWETTPLLFISLCAT
jgi:hypothetical protein